MVCSFPSQIDKSKERGGRKSIIVLKAKRKGKLDHKQWPLFVKYTCNRNYAFIQHFHEKVTEYCTRSTNVKVGKVWNIPSFIGSWYKPFVKSRKELRVATLEGAEHIEGYICWFRVRGSFDRDSSMLRFASRARPFGEFMYFLFWEMVWQISKMNDQVPWIGHAFINGGVRQIHCFRCAVLT